ncbi:hypothetical protein [Paenibacillus sp. 1P07SE]|uniref:hypothetical protein n=1 Tax=Paenibacillus sp. 1P07SE TaxID=3132209 RepID=UPI0039A504BD
MKRKEGLYRVTAAALALVVLLTVLLPQASASTYELTSTSKKALTELIAKTDKTTAVKLDTQYKQVQAHQSQEAEWDERIRTLHYATEERMAKLRTAIRQIDDRKIAQLEQQVQQSKARYKPILDMNASLNKQIAAAKPLKNKELNARLRSQSDQLKWAVQVAKSDIRSKEDALKTAKAAKTKTTKKLRDMLAAVDPVKVQVRASKSTISATKKHAATAWKAANQAVRSNDAPAASSAFATLVKVSGQLVAEKQKQHGLEVKISDIVAKVERELPRP